jgi:hypothetical protein
MIFFPAFAAALLICTQPGAWRLMLSWRTRWHWPVLIVLLVPHLFDVQRSVNPGPRRRPGFRHSAAGQGSRPLQAGHHAVDLPGAAGRRRGVVGAAPAGWLVWVVVFYVFYSRCSRCR